MNENAGRTVAIWRQRDDLLHTMECSNCGADAHYQIVDGVWRYEPYCAHCGARVYKQDDLPSLPPGQARVTVHRVEVSEQLYSESKGTETIAESIARECLVQDLLKEAKSRIVYTKSRDARGVYCITTLTARLDFAEEDNT